MRRSILKSKKANIITDGALFLIVIFVFSLVIFYGYSLFKDINADLQNESDLSQESKDLLNEKEAQYPSLFDGLYIVVFVILWATVMIASFFVDAHPIFWVFTIILSVFLIIGAGMLTNIFEETMAESEFVNYTDDFPMMFYISTHLVESIIAVIFSISLGLFGKWRFAG